jgi:hypothetical protein
MAKLGEELGNEPKEAVILLETEPIMGTVSSNPERDPACGAVLLHRAARFAYTPILHPLQACTTTPECKNESR